MSAAHGKGMEKAKTTWQNTVMYTEDDLSRLPDEELNRILTFKLFLYEYHTLMAQKWTVWSPWPTSESEYPDFCNTYEGMARVIAKLIERGYYVNITPKHKVIVTRSGQRSYEGERLPRTVAIAAILALAWV